MSESFRSDAGAVSRKKPVIRETSNGTVSIYARFPAGDFARLRLDSGLGNFAHYSSIIQKLEVFERVASQKEGRVSLALLEDRIVIGYLACWYPEKSERWSKLGDIMYELGAVEVSRNFREMGIAHTMVDLVFADDFFEERIAYMNGFSWHWDLDGSGLSKFQYRKMMLKFLKNWCFQEFYTNEPNIALRQENLFMARIGSRVSDDDRKRFRDLRFGISGGS